jgi:eukaryotic-like serine/threonine-protein kinase
MYQLVTGQFSTVLAQVTFMAERALVAKKLGRYDITRVLGKGAMGVVYEARDPNLNRKVAIKTVRVDSLSTDEAADYELRFRTEAHSAARLQHPNIVSVYDSDRDGDTPFLVMEFVKGEDLKRHLDAGQRYALEQSVRMMCDLLAALDYAHQSKIIHRDIKPANLLIEANGRVKLTDFGVARIQDSGEATRTQGAMVGTLKYMSPEQVQGLSVDAASDMFSAGIVLYQLLTDRRPFDGDSYFSIVNQIINTNPPAPSSINPMLPPALDAVVARALAKDKSQRFATAQDFSWALQTAARSADPTITPSANPYKTIEPHSTGAMEGSGSTVGSTMGNTSTTITQELELVYWKDVKDSDDALDLEGFIKRFPDGVYADLAKRRLKRIAQAKAAQGVPAYEATMVSSPPEAVSYRGVDDNTIPLPIKVPKVVAPVYRNYEDTNPLGKVAIVATPAPAVLPVQAVDTESEFEKIPTIPAPLLGTTATALAPSGRKNGWLVGAAAALVAAAAVWAWMGAGASAAPPVAREAVLVPVQSASAALPSPTASEPATTVATASATPTTDSTAAVSASVAAARVDNTPPANAASQAKTTVKVASTVKNTARVQPVREAVAYPIVQHSGSGAHATGAPHAVQPAPSPVATAASAHTPERVRDSAPAGPKEACDGRILFGYGACLIEQCARPAYQKHPVCVERRLQEEQRKEQLERR